MALGITDDGPAIAEENHKKIFNPFFTTKASGTGLGLAVCQKLCSANNAKIILDSSFRSGCRFEIQIKNNSSDRI